MSIKYNPVKDTERLLLGKEVKCNECKKGHYVPLNKDLSKNISFRCSNPDCGSFIQLEPNIEI